ncbi:MAG: DUF72 domain-containing protein [Verrucomicrobia bacterium]|nr:DUF72 domain-containing protein [Verrucomicrobiota bacterium]
MTSWIGTSGFQYPEWRGTFYPEKFPTSKMLPFYAERFATSEINYTFYRIPNSKTIGGWDIATPEHFRFGLKAPQKVTHVAKLRDCAELLEVFQRVVSGLGSKLGPVLFQLPPSFRKDAMLLHEFLDSLPGEIRAAFEFRHSSWFHEEIFADLQRHNAALCIAESSDLATPNLATADFGYLRLRREDYERADIVRWAKFIQEQKERWSHAFVYFKHEESGKGPQLAKQMIEELGVSSSPSSSS